MLLDHFVQAAVAKLEEERKGILEELGRGRASDFAAYRALVAKVTVLEETKIMLKELLRKATHDDEPGHDESS